MLEALWLSDGAGDIIPVALRCRVGRQTTVSLMVPENEKKW